MAVLMSDAPHGNFHIDEHPVQFTGTDCDGTDIFNVYWPITPQGDVCDGGVEFSLSSHFPLEVANEILTQQNGGVFDKLEYKYNLYDCVQILPTPNSCVIWGGSTFHAPHGNTSGKNRMSLFYSWKVKGLRTRPSALVVSTKEEVDYPHYESGFDWICKNSQIWKWLGANQVLTAGDFLVNRMCLDEIISFKILPQ